MTKSTALYKRSIKLLQEEMRADPDIVRPGTRYLFRARVDQRVGDRAGNIAWHTKDMIGAGDEAAAAALRIRGNPAVRLSQ
jgi:hypothetical protein